MKTIITKGRALALVLTLGLITNSIAQQNGFTYQGAVRNADGSIIADQALPVRISILSGTASGTLVWQETHNPNTNVLGIFTIVIGNGAKTGGTATQFADINWASAAHFIKTEVNFGSGFTEMSNVQLFSVPYALVSKKADEVINKPGYAFDELSDVNLTGLQNGDILKFNGTNWVVSQLPPSTVTTSADVQGDGSTGNPIRLAQQGAQQGQTLKWNGTAWVPSDDNGLPERIELNIDNSTNPAPAIKLNVSGSRPSYAQSIEMNTDSSSTALLVSNNSKAGNFGKTAISAGSTGESSSSHTAISGYVSGANSSVLRGTSGYVDVTGNTIGGFNAYGVTGTIGGESTNPAKISVGVYGQSNPIGAGESWGTGGFAGGGGTNRAFRGRANSVAGNDTTQFGAWLQANGDGLGHHYGVWANAMGKGRNIGVYGTASGGTENLAGLFEGDVKVTGRLLVDGETMMQNDMLYLGNPGLTTWQAVKDSSENYIGAQINFGGVDSSKVIGSGGGSFGNKFWEANNPESGYLHINTKGGTRASLEGVTNQVGEFATLTLSSTLGSRSRLTHAGLSLVNDANNRTMLTAFSSPAGGNIYVRSGFSNQVVGWFGTHQNSGFTQLVGHNTDSTFSGAILSGFWTGQPTLYIEDGAEIPHFIADIEVSDTINYGTRGRIRLGNSQNQFGTEIYGDGNARFDGEVTIGTNLVSLQSSQVDSGNPNPGPLSGNISLSNADQVGGVRMYGGFDSNNHGHIAVDGDSVNHVWIWGNGNIDATGTITAATVNQTSDARYKTNISTLNGSLNNVLKMRGVSYNWLDKSKSQKLQIGLIAQEVETIYPEFVHTDDKGMKSVNYAQMTAVLIEAIKELNAQIESLKNENASLKADLNKAETNVERISQLEVNMQNLMKMMQNSNTSNTVSTPNDK